MESVTAHAENGVGTTTLLYVGQEGEEKDVEEEGEEEVVGGGRPKDLPHHPLMITVQKVRIKPDKGKARADGWFPHSLTHNTRLVCTEDPQTKLPFYSLCARREWEHEWYGVNTPSTISGQEVILFPFGAAPPLIGEAHKVVVARGLGHFQHRATPTHTPLHPFLGGVPDTICNPFKNRQIV